MYTLKLKLFLHFFTSHEIIANFGKAPSRCHYTTGLLLYLTILGSVLGCRLPSSIA